MRATYRATAFDSKIDPCNKRSGGGASQGRQEDPTLLLLSHVLYISTLPRGRPVYIKIYEDAETDGGVVHTSRVHEKTATISSALDVDAKTREEVTIPVHIYTRGFRAGDSQTLGW